MNILFMGTPDFAAASLKTLLDNGYNVTGVVTQPDKPKGRGHKLTPPPVKLLAKEHGIEVYQPQRLKNGELEEALEKCAPDIIVVVAYGRILPQYVLDYARYGCINVHASLLPKYRGAAPIQWAIINGERYTGVTTMQMDAGLDTGDMLIKKTLEIGEYETAEQLFERLALLGGEALIETLEGIKSNTLTPEKQKHEEHTYAPVIKKEMALIDWSKTAAEIKNLVYGMNSWPMAYTFYNGEVLKIITASVLDKQCGGECGQLVGYDKKDGLMIKCGDGILCAHEVQFAGSKRMNIDDYLRGHRIDMDAVLGK
jgi:methionyl-tRNA formyltransferase